MTMQAQPRISHGTPPSRRRSDRQLPPSPARRPGSLSDLASAIRELGFDFRDEALREFSRASIKLIEQTRDDGPQALELLCRMLIRDKLFDATFVQEDQ